MAWKSWLFAAALIGVAIALVADVNSARAAERTATAAWTPQGAEAPRLIGMRLGKARRILKAAGIPFIWFRVQESGRAVSDLIVCYQGSARPLRLALTTRCPLRVPNVNGQPLRLAEPKLKALGISVGDYLDARDDDFPASITPKRSWILCWIDVVEYTLSIVHERSGDLYGHGETCSR